MTSWRASILPRIGGKASEDDGVFWVVGSSDIVAEEGTAFYA